MNPHRSVARLWIFRLLAVVAIPALILGLTEAALRLAGFGHSTDFVETLDRGGRRIVRDNPAFYTLFFPEHLLPRQLPLVLDAEKPEGRVRILLLGGSAAMGIPEPAFGMGPMLEEQLRYRYPGIEFEVLNLANTAINSHVVRRIASQLHVFDADAVVVYLGNNEVVGPFGAGSVFTASTPSRQAIDAQVALRSTRLGQALTALGSRFLAGDEAPSRWRGMAMFAERSVAPDDPALDAVRSHFARNLRDIVRAAKKRDTPVILASVGVNSRHCAPFASVHGDGIDAEGFAKAFDAAGLAWERGDLEAAASGYSEALSIDSTFADLRYRLGRLELVRGDTLRARDHLLEAVELDGLRFRADAAINATIRETAEREDGVLYAPVAESLAAVAPAGLPGRELFWEHVHLDLQGNRIAARVIAERVEAGLGDRLPQTSDRGWLSGQQLAASLGYTVFDRSQQISNIGSLVSQAPFLGQSDQAEQVGRLSRELESIRSLVDPDSLPRLWPSYEAAMSAREDSWIRRFRAANFLNEGLGDGQRAEPHWRRLTAELEHFPAAWNGYARALVLQGRVVEARVPLERSLSLSPHQPEVMLRLAGVLRVAEPRDADARWQALELEEGAARADGTALADRRLLDRYRDDVKWFENAGQTGRANRLRERIEALELKLRTPASAASE